MPRAGSNYNCVILAEGGRIVGRRLKHELPNYGTFDEKRVFTHGPLPEPILFKGVKLGVPICEDIWAERVCAHLARQGAEILLSPNGSPYEVDKDSLRQRQVRERVVETGLPLVYLNRVGGQDELVFDGSSFVTNDDGSIAVQLPDFEEAMELTDWVRTPNGWRCEPGERAEPLALSGRHVPGDDARAPRLCRRQRLSRRDPRPVGRDRQRAVGRGGGRCAGRRQGMVRDAAVQIYQRRQPGGCGRMREAAWRAS